MKSFIGVLAMVVFWTIVFAVCMAKKDRLTDLNGPASTIKNVQKILSTP